MLIERPNNYVVEDVEKDIVEIEEKYGFKFPEDYRKFLLKYNGGNTMDSYFELDETSDCKGFYGFGNTLFPRLDIDWRYLPGFVKRGVYPIGDDVWGNYIAMRLGEKIGEIGFLDHEKGFKYTKLTNSFREFVEACESEEFDFEESRKSIQERKQECIDRGFTAEIPLETLKKWQRSIDYANSFHQEEITFD